MKKTVPLIMAPLMAGPALADISSRQADLDLACEAAREGLLAPMREMYIEDCVQRTRRYSGDVRVRCERRYADFGNHTGARAALFYDLPECVEAFQFRRGNRRR